MSEPDQPEELAMDAVEGDVGPNADAAAPATTGGTFWQCGPGVNALDDPTPFGQENALQKLGKPPFEKTTRGRFRLLGYLATVYEHVAQDVAGRLPVEPAAPAEAAPDPSASQPVSAEAGEERST
jgi:hypothetical protein